MKSIVAIASILTSAALAQDIPKLSCEVSWIGNTHGGGEGQKPNGDAHGTYHVQMDVDGIWVSPDGKVYANCPADEAHLQGGVYQDGRLVWSIDIPWGGGGVAIAGDDQHIYAANRRGFTRYHRQSGKSTGWKALDTNLVTGLCVAGGRVYASDYYGHRVHVFQGGKAVLAFDAPFPGAVAVDKSGRVFVAQFEDPWNQPAIRLGPDRSKVLRFTPEGKSLPPIELGAASRPVALSIDGANRLLVADNGPDQNIKIFSDLDSTPRQSGTIGEEGGVFAGTPGLYGPGRFYGLTGIGTDAAGNVYVAFNGQGPAREVGNKTGNDVGWGGTVLESYTPGGQRRWAAYGLLFCDTADVDPASDGLDVYTVKQHYKMDYSKPAGQQWKLHGFLANVLKYPQDARIRSDNTSKGQAFMRRIQGKLFLFSTGMYAGSLHFFRFEPETHGEFAIPCGRLGQDLWQDTNGNGQEEPEEVQPVKLGDWGLFVDSRGDLWTTARGINHLPLEQLDANGVPRYRLAALTNEPPPSPFNNLKRIEYFPERDSMFLAGYTREKPYNGAHWKEMGTVLARYDNWSQGNRQPKWQTTLHWQSQEREGYATPHAMSVAGDYIFISFFHRGREVFCHVHSAVDGKLVGQLVPEGLGGTKNIGDTDMPYAIRAFKRSNGEYLVFVEDDRNAKNLLFRWKP